MSQPSFVGRSERCRTRLEGLGVATGETVEIHGFLVERPHVGYVTVASTPTSLGHCAWPDVPLPIEYAADRLDSVGQKNPLEGA